MNLCNYCSIINCKIKCIDLEPCLSCSKFVEKKEDDYQSRLIEL